MKPVILIAFANDWNDPLMTLYAERAGIERKLKEAEENDLCEVIILEAADTDKILKAFRDYRNRVAIFHFAGHAQDFNLYLETASGDKEIANSGGFAEFLSTQQGLQLVFLNACSTQLQVEAFLNAGIGAVIATSQAIDEGAATRLSIQFYDGLGRGNSIHKAYLEAAAAVKMKLGLVDQPDNNYYKDHQGETMNRFPWDFYLNPGSEVVKSWNLPDAAGNPLYGIPEPPVDKLPSQPFRYLKWYRRSDAAIFFGRSFEIRALYDKITDSLSPSVVHFYGQSGAGKSSLLAAGLFPRLDMVHQVRYGRRNAETGLVGSLKKLLDQKDSMSFLDTWLTIENEGDQPLTIILDQAEEVFTQVQVPIIEKENINGTGSSDINTDAAKELLELEAFISTLQTIFGHDRKPRGKLILSYRKEYLAEFESLFNNAQIAHSKVFLDVLGAEGIRDAILGLTKAQNLREQYQLEVEDSLPELIVNDLLRDKDTSVAPVLQILLSKLWENTPPNTNGNKIFTRDTYHLFAEQGLLLEDFLNHKISELRISHPELVESGLVQDMLTFHTTSKGTANKRTLSEIIARYQHRADIIPGLLRELEKQYLLVEITASNDPGGTIYSLAHDTLAPLIRENNQKSEWQGQIATRIIGDRASHWKKGESKYLLNSIDLDQVEMGRPGMRILTAHENAFVEASQKKRLFNLILRYGLILFTISAIAVIVILTIKARNARMDHLEQANKNLNERIDLLAIQEQLNLELLAMRKINDSLAQTSETRQSQLEIYQQYNEDMQNTVLFQDLNIRAGEIVADYLRKGFSGSVYLELNGALIVYGGFGLSQQEEQVAFKPSTVFSVGSLTEAFTATAIMQLFDNGKLDLADQLVKYFPDVPQDKKEITIKQLLQHRSGFEPVDRENYRNIKMSEAEKKIFRQKLTTGPDERKIISATNYILLAMIVEKASGQNFYSYCQQQIFLPNGMSQTGFNPSKKWQAADQAYSFGIKKRKNLSPGSWPAISWGAMGTDGLMSNMTDLAVFLENLTDGQIISRNSMEQMFSQRLGWNLIKKEGSIIIYQDGTGSFGQGATLRYYPGKNARMVILSNTYSGDTPALFQEMAAQFESEIFGVE